MSKFTQNFFHIKGKIPKLIFQDFRTFNMSVETFMICDSQDGISVLKHMTVTVVNVVSLVRK